MLAEWQNMVTDQTTFESTEERQEAVAEMNRWVQEAAATGIISLYPPLTAPEAEQPHQDRP